MEAELQQAVEAKLQMVVEQIVKANRKHRAAATEQHAQLRQAFISGEPLWELLDGQRSETPGDGHVEEAGES